MSQENKDKNINEELNYDFDDEYNDFEYYDEYEDFEDYEAQQRQALIEEMKEIANDKVEKDKTYEEYVQEKRKEEELLTFLGPQIITKTQEEIETIKKDLKKYLIENQKEILKENMIYIPDSVIQEIPNVPQDGLIEINIEEDIGEIVKIVKYELLKNFGMAFMNIQKNKVMIHIPLIKEMKKAIEDKKIMDKQKNINEKIHILFGICELHGAIKTKKVYHLMEDFYGEIDKEKFAKFLIMACEIFGIGQIKIEPKTGSLQFMYHNLLDEEMAKKIIKANKEVKTYTKEEYLKYGTKDYIVDTKGYKRLKEQFDSDIFDEDDLFKLLNNIIIPYTIEARTGSKNTEEIMKKLTRDIIEMLGEEGLIELGIDLKEIEKALQEITEEIPKWINN